MMQFFRVAGGTLASMYAILLVFWYVASKFTEIVRLDEDHQYTMEKYGFFTYMYACGIAYITYILTFVLQKSKFVENQKVTRLHITFDKLSQTGSSWRLPRYPTTSHGSVTVRLGALIFGLGSIVYYIIEVITVLCSHEHTATTPVLALNDFLAIGFSLLQTFMVFMYPRLNISCHELLNQFGTMHLVALNIIMWTRTLIRESIHEAIEALLDDPHGHVKDSSYARLLENFYGHHSSNAHKRSVDDDHYYDSFEDEHEGEHHEDNHDSEDHKDSNINILAMATKAEPILYPHLIEFALIGASIALLMAHHIGKTRTIVDEVDYRPNPKRFLKKRDWSKSLIGAIFGSVLFLAEIILLVQFLFGDDMDEDEVEAEYHIKIANVVVNLTGISACLIGFFHITKLHYKEHEMGLDKTLLRFTLAFFLMYSSFTILKGAYSNKSHDHSNIYILNGVVEITQVILQVTFLEYFSQKSLHPPRGFSPLGSSNHFAPEERPGRQITVFLFFFNISKWMVCTFEMQKVKASPQEAEFFGFMPWLVILRLTMPLVVFFRFHSSVVLVELWKEVYADHNSRVQSTTANSDEEAAAEEMALQCNHIESGKDGKQQDTQNGSSVVMPSMQLNHEDRAGTISV